MITMKTRVAFYWILFLLFPLVYFGCTDDDPEQFTLTVQVDPADGGSVSPTSGTFDEGTQVTLTATPAAGYALLNWSGAASGNDNPLVIAMTSDKNITAVFSLTDGDGDGVPDLTDQCPDTPAGQGVDANGCASSQTDADQDGVTDDRDLCPNTPAGESADANGCSASQNDADEDGVSDALDQCPDTPAGEDVDVNGCSAPQLDADEDGVTDDLDLCPDTHYEMEVDGNGCPLGTEYTYIPSDGFELTLIEMGLDNQLDDMVLTRAIDTVTTLGLASEPWWSDTPIDITDFTGIEDFAALETLSFYGPISGITLNDQLLDLSQNRNLKTLSLHCVNIDNLDLSQTLIEGLHLYGFADWMPCDSWVNQFDLSGLTTLKSLTISNIGFEDLNAVLSSAASVEVLWVYSPKDTSGNPVAVLDLSTLASLTNLHVGVVTAEGPGVINIRNGANQQLVEFSLGFSVLMPQPGPMDWEPCVEADDPAYIEEIIVNSSDPDLTPPYTVTTDCTGGG